MHSCSLKYTFDAIFYRNKKKPHFCIIRHAHSSRIWNSKALALIVHKKKIFKVLCMLKFDLWLWPHLWPNDHDLNKIESPCPKDATYKILKLLHLQLQEEDVWNSYEHMLIFYLWTWSHWWPQGHDLSKLQTRYPKKIFEVIYL